MRVALVYDRVNKWGGAERVLLALHELFPDAPLYTSVHNPAHARWAKVFTIKTSFLQHIPIARGAHEYFAMFMPLAFEGFNFDRYDLVISVTSEAAKGIITHPATKHICICLTPTRYLWSGYGEYFNNQLFRMMTSPLVWYLRRWDLTASDRPDVMVAISGEVKSRVKKYYKKTVSVIYPPVTLQSRSRRLSRSGDYFLVVSRLVQYKRVDIAISACNQLGLPLKIVGVGSQFFRLKKLAGPTVEFIGNLTDAELVEYYKGCKALIFPGKEDFGLTIVEAQAYGKPVIAFRGGGALETVIGGETGMFFYPQTAAALKSALKRFQDRSFRPAVSRKQAEKFNKKRFKREILQLVDNVFSRNI